MSEANKTQIGGTHYKGSVCPHCGESIEHWDLAWLFRWDNFQYAITKYVMRWREKGGWGDLEKAEHVLAKNLEVVQRDSNRMAQPGDLDTAGQPAPTKLILPAGVDEVLARRVLAANGIELEPRTPATTYRHTDHDY